MISVLFDTNVYDLLANNGPVCETVNSRIHAGLIKVIVSRTVAEELLLSPFKKVPDLFPYEYVGNTGRVDIMCVDDSIGAGEVFDMHVGNSMKLNDALIADAASWHADWLVSEDVRLRKRTNEQEIRCKAISFEEFTVALLALG